MQGLDPLVLLALALGLDALVGEMGAVFRHVRHPVVLMGQAIAVLDQALNRPGASSRVRRAWGVGVVVLLVGGCWTIGELVHGLSTVVPLGWGIELFLVATLLAQRSLHDHVLAVAKALETGGLPAGRRAVAALVSRDPEALDEGAVARAAIESLAENFGDAVVAPVFWYALLGLPGVLAFKMVSTLDSMIGYRTETYRDFGWAAARLDDLANLIPARLAGILLVGAGWGLRGGSVGRGWRVMGRDHGHHRSPNAGWPEAAMAGVLGVRLSGPRVYPGQPPRQDPWVGEGPFALTPSDIRRALTVFWRACLLQGAALIGLAALT
ncbi:cobalamin biosynthesis protein CobD [Pararhodospirillum oryzae]|uniref:Cobalamin biosynthesis protein CobD n=2 Tax=Pararhodospirillum oryzae TaxID=478448 RepID=A0A512HC46_9PROT|nr:cobalamin biosynthesis protein CobD [Pararhodospirillum oryzae]